MFGLGGWLYAFLNLGGSPPPVETLPPCPIIPSAVVAMPAPTSHVLAMPAGVSVVVMMPALTVGVVAMPQPTSAACSC